MTTEPDPRALPDARALTVARDRIRGRLRHTPLEPSPWLSERAGVPVYLKLECWQVTGSFKARGALNAVASLSAADRADGLVTASAGNHGLAVAHAARLFDVPATIFVPATAPRTKKSRIRELGGVLREVDGTYDDAAEAARSFAGPGRGRLLHPFSDPSVVAGQATVALEALEDLPELRELVVPVGGGGLAAGTGAALRAFAPEARVRGVQSTATRAMFEAFRSGGIVHTPDAPTLCDGLAGETEREAFERARSALHDLRLVEEAAVAPAIAALFEHHGVVAEGSGAVAVAALLEGAVSLEGPAVVVISGGNIDRTRLGPILMEA